MVRVRIAISGSAGTGKSTLSKRLAAVMGISWIGEGMREYLEATGTALHMLGWEGMRALVVRLWEERKEAEERATAGFVADRSAFDFAAFWLYYRFADDSALTERFFAETLAPGRYDRVYLLPWGVIPLEADGVRSSDRWVQLHAQTLIDGVLARHGEGVRRVHAVDLDARVAEVLADLGLG